MMFQVQFQHRAVVVGNASAQHLTQLGVLLSGGAWASAASRSGSTSPLTMALWLRPDQHSLISQDETNRNSNAVFSTAIAVLEAGAYSRMCSAAAAVPCSLRLRQVAQTIPNLKLQARQAETDN
ncbi:hypothetical protein QOS04_35380 [Cupriavidus sp. LEh21]|nr:MULTISPECIES: hypothetical protein [unclassified Cupriavidus]MDK2661826.1 hypothetical protein [Cupriavidus sp. LEh21]